MEENNCNRGAQSRLPLVGPGDQNLIRKETLAAGRFAPGLQAHSSMRKCSKPLAKLAEPREPSLLAYREPAEVERTAHFAVLQNQLFGVHRRLHEGSAK